MDWAFAAEAAKPIKPARAIASGFRKECMEDLLQNAARLQCRAAVSELVPEFFPQVPMDDFDGKPFRYLPDKKLIYSVGPDLKDSWGEGFSKHSEDYDLPFKIEF